MKTTFFLLFLSGIVFTPPHDTLAAQTAQADLVNSSLKLNTSACDCDIGGLVWHMDFSSAYAEERNAANHELAPSPQPGPYSHWSWMLLEDPSMWTSTSYMDLNLPSEDTNGNGMPDFFETGLPATVSSPGIYQIDWGPCPLTVTWTRAAGTTTGSYQLTMHDSMLGDIGPFRGSFEIVKSHGTLQYTPAAKEVAGHLTFPATAVSPELQGPVRFAPSVSDPANTLTLMAGALTNEFDNFAFEACSLNRHASVYSGAFGLPTGYYHSWTLLITDPNDSDHDGIPDLSDAALPPPNASGLTLKTTASGFQLVIAGNTGRTCYLEETASLGQPSWGVVKTFALTNDPHALELQRENGSAPKFWRVRVE